MPRRAERRGFSLLELTAVLVIAGMIAAVTAISFGGVLRSATMTEASQRLRWADGQARAIARGSGETVTLAFEGARVTRTAGKDVASFDLPAGFRIAESRMVSFTPEGRSPSYAVQLQSRRETGWVVVAGLSGEAVMTRDPNEVAVLLRP